VFSRVIDLVRFASDASPYRYIPQVVVRPNSIEDIQKIFRRIVIGSEGTLGFVAEVAYWAIPLPNLTTVAWLPFATVGEAVVLVYRLVKLGAEATVLAVFALTWMDSPALVGQSSLRQDVLTTWTKDQGLPRNFVRAISQTSDGFLWVGTMNGLVRFDGLRFRGFSKDGPSALQEKIGDLEPDFGDGLWIATASGLIHYSHQRFQPVPLLGRSHYRIDAMARGWDGEVWIYSDGKLAPYQGDLLQIRPLPEGTLQLRDLAEGRDHTWWIADGEALFAL
jgi:hypothetical protein